jgi:hypothetical protein
LASSLTSPGDESVSADLSRRTNQNVNTDTAPRHRPFRLPFGARQSESRRFWTSTLLVIAPIQRMPKPHASADHS